MLKLVDHNELSNKRKVLVNYMDRAMYWWLRGKPIPYLWGGQYWAKYKSIHHPYKKVQGVDCSGFVILGLIEIGLLPKDFDTTAHGLFRKFKSVSANAALPGDLAFFGSSKRKITHVGMLYQQITKDHWVMLEAGGGGPSCKTVEIAMAKGAFVRPSWTNRRRDFQGFGRILKPIGGR